MTQRGRQRYTIDKLAHDVGLVFVCPHFVDGDDIRMLELGSGSRFVKKHRLVFTARRADARQLDGDGPLQLFIPRAPNGAEAAGSQEL